jgi:amidohydrolase family protein
VRPGLGLTALLLVAVGPAGAGDLPLFDTHIHYSRPDWSVHSPAEVLQMLAAAGVTRALVSSTPDDGTVRLWEQDPRRIVPELRPYRTPSDASSWYRDPAVLAWVEERLRRGIYKGIGEVHLSVGAGRGPVLGRFVALAVARSLVMHAHADAEAVRELIALDPRVRVLWAHAGMTAGPAEVHAMLDRYPTLRVELALRTDVAPAGALDPEWRALFLRYPDRFCVGTDTWVTSRWAELGRSLAVVRGWLAELPPDVAQRIAFANAARLYGLE